MSAQVMYAIRADVSSSPTVLLPEVALTRQFISEPSARGELKPVEWPHLARTFWLSGGDIRWPMRIELEQDPDEFCARETSTGIFGVGSTPAEAVEDLRHALVGHRDVLEKAGPLSADLEDQLRVLRHHLRTA